MRKIIVSTFLTLDGIMQAPGAPNEDVDGGFRYGGWQAPYFEDDGMEVAATFHTADALLLGRKTYDIFSAYWPNAKDVPFADAMNNITKYVASRTKDKLGWQNSILLEGDVVESVVKLKQQEGKDIIVVGSGELAQTLMQHNLIDKYSLLIHPLVLGSGKRLFRANSPRQDLELLESKTTKNGVSVMTYAVKNK